MLRSMVFIDYQNFNINLYQHFNYSGKSLKKIDFIRLGQSINEKINYSSQVIKTYLFAYKPSEELMQLKKYSDFYSWLDNLKKHSNIEIIEGRQEIRKYPNIEFDINNPETYTTTEKETDINLATNMLSKAFFNAYDIAILVSGDTDYVNVVKTLHELGKIVIIAHFPHQNINKYIGICDRNIILYDNLLNQSCYGNKDVIYNTPIEQTQQKLLDEKEQEIKLLKELLKMNQEI